MAPRPTLILHQYDTSPFSEKVRKVLAHKRLAWCAVDHCTEVDEDNSLAQLVTDILTHAVPPDAWDDR